MYVIKIKQYLHARDSEVVDSGTITNDRLLYPFLKYIGNQFAHTSNESVALNFSLLHR